eukprot:Skav201518  [mRNA]  locus=scaffold4516:8836:13613:- [translate_table: standard]
MPQVRCARGSGFRSRPLVTEVVDSVPSGPSKVAVSSIALARKEEECRPFSREHVELHLKDRGATFFDFCCREAVGSMPEMPTALPAPKGFLQVPQRPPSTRTTTASPAIRSRHPSRPPSSRASQVSRGESPTSPRFTPSHVKAFAMAQPGFTMASKRELLQIADELLHTLTTRLKDGEIWREMRGWDVELQMEEDEGSS